MKAFFKYIVVTIITWEARLVLLKYKPFIIAVTGSVGKTGTKDAIDAAIGQSVFSRASTKGLNSETGVPLSILGRESGWYSPWKWFKTFLEGLALIVLKNHYPRFLVLEVGADHPGDIEALASWLKPNIAIITAIPDIPAHVEFFNSAEEVAREKSMLAKYLRSDGVLILNGDDKKVLSLAEKFKDKDILLFGTELQNDIRAEGIEIAYEKGLPIGMGYKVSGRGFDTESCVRGSLGRHQVYSHLAALCVAHAIGVSSEMAVHGLSENVGPKGRMRIIPGALNTTIIDDSYNSSPSALRAALDTLKKLEVKGKRIAVLGDMLELGKNSTDAHKKGGVQAAGLVNYLVTVGVRSHSIAQAARDAGLKKDSIREFETGESQKAGKYVRSLLEEGDVVLVKGSQNGIRLEKVVREIMAEPSEARRLLVRQESEWLNIE